MMFTEREHFNIFDHDHLVVVLVEDGALDGVLDAVLVPLCEEQHRLCSTQRRCNNFQYCLQLAIFLRSH